MIRMRRSSGSGRAANRRLGLPRLQFLKAGYGLLLCAGDSGEGERESRGKPNGVPGKANSRRSEATLAGCAGRWSTSSTDPPKACWVPERSGGGSAGIWGAGERGGSPFITCLSLWKHDLLLIAKA